MLQVELTAGWSAIHVCGGWRRVNPAGVAADSDHFPTIASLCAALPLTEAERVDAWHRAADALGRGLPC